LRLSTKVVRLSPSQLCPGWGGVRLARARKSSFIYAVFNVRYVNAKVETLLGSAGDFFVAEAEEDAADADDEE
jgi:hypothetical protein